MDIANRELDYRIAKLDKLAGIRSRFPYLSDDEIIRLFPEFKDVIDINISQHAQI
jgi:hypothetical protein